MKTGYFVQHHNSTAPAVTANFIAKSKTGSFDREPNYLGYANGRHSLLRTHVSLHLKFTVYCLMFTQCKKRVSEKMMCMKH